MENKITSVPRFVPRVNNYEIGLQFSILITQNLIGGTYAKNKRFDRINVIDTISFYRTLCLQFSDEYNLPLSGRIEQVAFPRVMWHLEDQTNETALFRKNSPRRRSKWILVRYRQPDLGKSKN